MQVTRDLHKNNDILVHVNIFLSIHHQEESCGFLGPFMLVKMSWLPELPGQVHKPLQSLKSGAGALIFEANK